MVKDKYEKILCQFEMLYPRFYARAVDWWASGRMAITLKLNNGELIEYNHLDNNIRFINTDRYIDDEEAQRKAFGHNLQKMISFSKMSKTDLAERLGISNAMLSRYLHGNSMPSATRAHQIARLMGCSTDELFDDTYIE